MYWLIPRSDRWFELHNLSRHPLEDSYLAWLSKTEQIVYMQEGGHPDILRSVRYPRRQMLSQFGPYFGCTLCYMLALAISEGFTEISMFGTEMFDRRYDQMRKYVEYFIGIARGRGIRVALPPESSLESWPKKIDDGVSGRSRLEARLELLESQKRRLEEDRLRLRTEATDLSCLHQNMRKEDWLSVALNQADGAIAEIHFWLNRCEAGTANHR